MSKICVVKNESHFLSDACKCHKTLFTIIIPAGNQDTMQRCYNVVNFLPNPHKRHPIARPWGWAMGCLLWVQPLINSVSLAAILYIQYNVLLDRVITALACNNANPIWVTSNLMTTKRCGGDFKYENFKHSLGMDSLIMEIKITLGWMREMLLMKTLHCFR